MPSSTLIVYEPLSSFKSREDYWQEYVKYYEKYWGGPTSPFGMWFGNEYAAFKKSIANHLGIGEDEVDDCLFMKDEKGNYFLAPTNNTNNIFSSENIVPLEWFILVAEDERNDFYSHWGFNSIHYNSKLSDSRKRVNKARTVLENSVSDNTGGNLSSFLGEFILSINYIDDMLCGFDCESFLILNYGDICTNIHPYTLKNENSVFDIKNFLDLVTKKNIEEAELKLKLFFQKWDDIRDKCMGIKDNSEIQ